jgi:hypothetical protein
MSFHGKEILDRVIKKAGYPTLLHLVAENTLFTHPETVKKTANKNLFRTIRDFPQRGKMIDWLDSKKVMCCDNEGPNRTFLWCNGDFKYSEVQFNHVYSNSQNVEVYTSLANLCVTPAFIAKLTDTDDEVKKLLKYRAYDLFGFYQGQIPIMPSGYGQLKWKDFIPPIQNLEVYLLQRMNDCRKSRSAISAREIGWYFSDYLPDSRIK